MMRAVLQHNFGACMTRHNTNKGGEMTKKLKEWSLDEQIKTKSELVMFLMCAVNEVKIPHAPTPTEMQWLKIACND